MCRDAPRPDTICTSRSARLVKGAALTCAAGAEPRAGPPVLRGRNEHGEHLPFDQPEHRDNRSEFRSGRDTQLPSRIRIFLLPAVFHIILRYLHNEPLRLRIQTQLNRGEARHGLARWLFFADQGEFRTSDFEMIMNKASCLSLLSNAVVLWNTLQIERIVAELRADGTTIRDEDLVHVWPLQRRHITPNGVYFANRTMPAFVLPEPIDA
jgi:hypothetical protein